MFEKKRPYDVASRDPQAGESRGEAEAAIAGLAPSIRGGAIDDGRPVGVDDGGTLEKAEWGEWDVVGGASHASLHRLPPLTHFRSPDKNARKYGQMKEWEGQAKAAEIYCRTKTFY